MFSNDSEALGYITWWGLSPAINLLKDEFSKNATSNLLYSCRQSANIFCFGMGDARHIIKTIPQSMDCNQRYKARFV